MIAANANGWFPYTPATNLFYGLNEACDMLLQAPSARTPVVQQIHIVAAHVICALVERAMFPQD